MTSEQLICEIMETMRVLIANSPTRCPDATQTAQAAVKYVDAVLRELAAIDMEKVEVSGRINP